MNLSYNDIYRAVYSSFEKDEIDHATLHLSSIKITDALWQLYMIAERDDLPNAKEAIGKILTCFTSS